MDGCVSPFIGEGSFVSKLCGGMGARHGACHACPLGHFMNSARGQVTLYMTVSRYGRPVGVLSLSGQAAVGSRLVGAVGSRLPARQSSWTGSRQEQPGSQTEGLC